MEERKKSSNYVILTDGSMVDDHRIGGAFHVYQVGKKDNGTVQHASGLFLTVSPL